MYTLIIDDREGFDERTQQFINVKACTLHLEHSLIAISKWESKWHKPFLDGERRTDAEIRDYARCMCMDKNVDDNVWSLLTPVDLIGIMKYTEDSHSGTTFGASDNNDDGHHEIMSSELIYYYMSVSKIPFSCEKWNLNRLLILLKICGIKNNPKDKPKASQSQLLNKYASMHAARKKAKK